MDKPTQEIHPSASNDSAVHVPASGKKPTLRDAVWLLPFALRGFWELARARIAFEQFHVRDIPALNRAARSAERSRNGTIAPLVDRIGYVLPRLSKRLPWRSDCLIQTIAGQHWLAARGVASEIQIGVERPQDGEFGAHAWLMASGKVVTGGEIERYSTILGSEATGSDVIENPHSEPEKPSR